MKDYFFEKEADITEFESDGLSDLAINELVILEFSDQIQKNSIKKLVSKVHLNSQRVFIKLSYYDKELFSKMSEYSEFGVKRFCLQLNLEGKTDFAIGTAHVQPMIVRSKTATEAKKIFETIKQYDISLELNLTQKDIADFYAIIAYLSDLGVPWVLVNPKNLIFEKNVDSIKNSFELLRMNTKTNTRVYFSGSHPQAEHWNARTGNVLGGPKYIDIDVANSCTHNCVFCGLYADEAVEKYKKNGGGTLPKREREKMAARIDRQSCLDFINSLPDSVQSIQFGGIGDPFTHRNIVEFIESARERNINVSCLTNFSYMNPETLDRLHHLSGKTMDALNFIVNISAANAKTYHAVRPNQKEKTFDKVVESLKYSQELRRRDGKGISLWLMSVTNKLNFRDMPEFAALAKYIGAELLWIKPIEVHGDEMVQYLISEEEQFEYARHAKLLLHVAEKIKVKIFMPEVLEIIIAKFSDQLKVYELKTSLTKQVENLAEHSELLRRFYINNEEGLAPRNPAENPRYHYLKPYENLPDVTPKILQKKVLPENELFNLGVVNADLQRDYYDNLPCKIGYNYFRVEVQGMGLPCCISNIQLGNINGKAFNDIWLSDSLNVFRNKMDRIHKERFHRNVQDWVFCQQCPHLSINIRHNSFEGLELEGFRS